jgi:hypothetical protein
MEELYSCVYRLSSNPMMAFSVSRYVLDGSGSSGSGSGSGGSSGTVSEASGRRRGRSLASSAGSVGVIGGNLGQHADSYDESTLFGGYLIPRRPQFYNIFDVRYIRFLNLPLISLSRNVPCLKYCP